MGCVFVEKEMCFEMKFECIYLWTGNIESFNLIQMCNIFEAINICINISVHLSAGQCG